jgi:hypothetical protein
VRRGAVIAVVAGLLGAPATAGAAVPVSCPGEPIAPDHVITGDFGAENEGAYVLLPFDVPAGTTAVRVRYCHDQPETPLSRVESHTLDLGLYEPRTDPSRPWGTAEFRGWGGSSHPDVIVSPEGFTSDAEYAADPRRQVPGRTTRGFLPGPIAAGEWAVELGLAAIASRTEGDLDGSVSYRVEIELSEDPTFADEPYQPAGYDARPARSGPGWYAGDMHVHAEHSSLGDAPMREVFDYAFGASPDGAGLDFMTLSDYVSGSAWGEIGRYQADYPGKLIVRSSEVITYRGHVNSHASTDVADYRTGPLYERRPDGGLSLVRAAGPALRVLDQVHGSGGFTQINHPTIFPSPPFPASLCRGCSWSYSDEETDYSKVDAVEIATGPAGLDAPGEPGPNPFTVTGIEFWEEALAAGHKIAAVGSSDSHHAGRTPNPVTQAPIGTATTVVFADELSERGIRRGVEAGHTYVKVTGNDAPDLRFEARVPGSRGRAAIMGDTVRAPRAEFTARVLGGGPAFQLLVMRNGRPLRAVPVTSGDFTFSFEGEGLGRYRLQLQRGSTIEGVSSPIYLEAARRDTSQRDGRRRGEPDRSGGGGSRGRDEPGGSGGAESGVVEDGGAAGGSLPFTGHRLLLLAAVALALLGTGAALRGTGRA